MRRSNWSDRTLREAAEWVALLNAETDSDKDSQTVVPRFRAWLKAAPENHSAFRHFQRTWDEAGLLTDPADWDVVIPSLGSNANNAKHSHGLSWRLPAWGGALAALFALIVAGVVYVFLIQGKPSCSDPSTDSRGGCIFAHERKVSPHGEVSRLHLADGTHAELQGELKLDVSDQRRHIDLEQGEVLLQVAKSTVPFEVGVGDSRVQAVGTTFSVKRTGVTGFVTTVSVGVVEVYASNQQHVTLQTGEAAEFDGVVLRTTANNVTQEAVSAPAAPLVFNFKDTPLDEVARMFNRRNPRILLVVDTTIAKRTIGGTFLATDPSGFANTLVVTLGIHESVSRDPKRRRQVIRLSANKRQPATSHVTAALIKGSQPN